MTEQKKQQRSKWTELAEQRQWNFERWQRGGTNLKGEQIEFMKDVATRDWTWYHRGHEPIGPEGYVRENMKIETAMGPRRNVKMVVLERMRSGLSDLAALKTHSAPQAGDIGLKTWITKEDARSIFNLQDICDVIEYCCTLFGKEYADRMLQQLEVFYSRESEEIVLMRSINRGHRNRFLP